MKELRSILKHIGNIEQLHIHNAVTVEGLGDDFPDFKKIITQ